MKDFENKQSFSQRSTENIHLLRKLTTKADNQETSFYGRVQEPLIKKRIFSNPPQLFVVAYKNDHLCRVTAHTNATSVLYPQYIEGRICTTRQGLKSSVVCFRAVIAFHCC